MIRGHDLSTGCRRSEKPSRTTTRPTILRVPLYRNLPFPKDFVVLPDAPQKILPLWQSQRHAAVPTLITGQLLIHGHGSTALARRNRLHQCSASDVDRYPNPRRAEP